jgi:hypothetical protein
MVKRIVITDNILKDKIPPNPNKKFQIPPVKADK